ncbi:hypothetical protein [Prauserella marina]|uniref:hypothetical protein n=1 Tax=Prauserella marina TaxID=530584 RepID=UPI00115FDD18|nr:hypothetical protein [Prauserella marina]
MTVRRLRAVLSVFATIALIVLTMVAALAEAGPQAQQRLALASAAAVVVMSLTRLPLIRPQGKRRHERSRLAATLGGSLIVLLWLTRASAYGYAVFVFTVGLSDTTFDATAAALAVTGRLLTLAAKTARHLAGFVVDWDFPRGLNILRYLLGLVATVPLVGFGGLLAEFVENVVLWVPVHTYELLHGWGLRAWLAVVLACVAYLPVVFVAVVTDPRRRHRRGPSLRFLAPLGEFLAHLPRGGRARGGRGQAQRDEPPRRGRSLGRPGAGMGSRGLRRLRAARWQHEYSGMEPEWRNPPFREDFREDLRRFPVVRTVRPAWLRERLASPRKQPALD